MRTAREVYDDWHRDHPTGEGAWYDLARIALEGRLGGASVLEIGCGSGGFSAWMTAAGASNVVGVDFSATAIENAVSSYEAENLTFRIGNIEQIEDGDARFDVVVSCETIEHVPSPARAVSELGRVLRPSGVLILSTPNYLSITGAHRLFREMTGRHWDEGGQPIVHWTMLPRTLWWMRRAGLTVHRIHGDGWYVPVRGRPGGYAYAPPRRLRRLLEPLALHQVIEAHKI